MDRTALHWASQNGDAEVVQMLIQNGCDVNSKDTYGQTALHWASENGHAKVVQILIQNGCDVNSKECIWKDCTSFCICNMGMQKLFRF